MNRRELFASLIGSVFGIAGAKSSADPVWAHITPAPISKPYSITINHWFTINHSVESLGDNKWRVTTRAFEHWRGRKFLKKAERSVVFCKTKPVQFRMLFFDETPEEKQRLDAEAFGIEVSS